MTQKFDDLVRTINQLKEVELRDLAWLILAEKISFNELPYALIYDFNQDVIKLIDWLKENSFQRKKIESHQSLPLGKYAESLIHFYLTNYPAYKLHGFNIQLNRETKTIGEVDFLFRDLTNEINYHLEFALKYYLKTHVNNELTYLGPSSKDSLKRKTERMISHQCSLLEKNKELLPVGLQAYSFQSKLLMKGSLFLPFKEWKEKSKANPINMGWWMELKNFEMLDNSNHIFSIHTSRKHWIYPFYYKLEKYKFQETFEKVSEFLSNNNEIMIVRWIDEQQPIDRGFVMKNGWPTIKTLEQQN